MKEEVCKVLDSLGIAYEDHDHPPVFTMEEATEHWSHLQALWCKNLFLRNYKGNQHYLVVIPFHKSLDIKAFAEREEIQRPGFASEKRLQKYLDLKPGSVSPFGLIADKDNHVKLYLDPDLKVAEKVAFHPNINTSTFVISYTDFAKFLEWTGNEVTFLHQ